MSSPMNTLLLGLTMYDTLLIITSVLMVGVPSIHTHHTFLIDSTNRSALASQANSVEKRISCAFYCLIMHFHNFFRPEDPIFNFYMTSIFPYITPIIYPVSIASFSLFAIWQFEKTLITKFDEGEGHKLVILYFHF